MGVGSSRGKIPGGIQGGVGMDQEGTWGGINQDLMVGMTRISWWDQTGILVVGSTRISWWDQPGNPHGGNHQDLVVGSTGDPCGGPSGRTTQELVL